MSSPSETDINGALSAWIVGVFAALGDPNKVQESAQPLVNHANEIRLVHENLTTTTKSLSWSGPGADAHSQNLRKQVRVADEAAANLETAQKLVTQHADQTQYVAQQVVGVILEIVETLAIGMALTALFSALADVAWVRLGSLIQRVMGWIMRFRMALRGFVKSMTELSEITGQLAKGLETLIVDYAPAYTRALPGFYIADAVPQLMTGRPVDWGGNAWQIALFGT